MDRSSLMTLLREVTSRFSSGEVSIYAIGGTALTLLGLKPSTVDVDFVVETLDDLRTLRSALKYSLGAKEFSSEDPSFLFGNIPALIVYYVTLRFPVEIYPHEIGSLVFFPSDFLRMALRAITGKILGRESRSNELDRNDEEGVRDNTVV